MTRPTLVALATAVLIAGGCGDEGSGGDDTAQAARPAVAAKAYTTTHPAARAGKRIAVVDSEYGPVVADAKGEALYLFDKEKSPKSRCYGECARVWPPAITKGKPRAGEGAEPSLLGTTRRRNGKLQVTYKGQPLYYYVDDSPGTILCHDVAEFGGLWLVVEPGGAPVG